MVSVRSRGTRHAGTPGVLAAGCEPTVLIGKIRDSFPEATIVYTRGGCYGLYEILRAVYPEADAYYDPVIGHVYTKIGDHLYDINGRAPVKLDKLIRMRDDRDLMRKVHRWTPTYKFLAG